jgi:hypothetical protein
VTNPNSADPVLLETLARDSGRPLQAVENLYEQEYAALAEGARIPNFISLLALRRVRYQLLSAESKAVH